MALKAGIIGLPNVGKSSLFSALTNLNVEVANYPFATIEPNTAVVEIADKRLLEIAKIVNPEKIVYSTFSFVDIAGLIKGAASGEGLGNKFLANVRDVDCLVHVVRCFEDSKIIHVNQQVNPLDDVEVINYELILSDLSVVENVLKRVEKKAQNTNDKKLKLEAELAKKLQNHFQKGFAARSLDYSNEEKQILSSWQLLTIKPVLYVGNVDQNSLTNLKANPHWQQLQKIAEQEGNQAIPISVAFEQQISAFDESEKQIFLAELGLQDSSLDRLVYSTFKLLNLGSFFTAGVKEVRSWVFKMGSFAPQCSAVIHSDFEKKFIRVEVIDYQDFINYGGEKGAKDNGKLKVEGKTYVIKDGDICHFRINN